MRLLKRNLTDIEYLPYNGVGSDLNDDGEHTGEFHPSYGTAVPYRGNISVPSGTANQTFYGLDTRYTHVLIIDDKDAGIDETGLIRYNGALYDIVAVRPSINVLSVALRKQTVNHADGD